ncbi:hypothetical protein CLV51_103627 [Chitinophaga niastensis]|uniref:DUF304 domain-containing protein n=1 Tax=Chitinophaga niastensis TaxID=536980 RepID=A0A2P8HKA5_CHINA|nr:hypothetical protein [Chitinophaga niastensis]PSL46646.1 hypothetical protein CLV51_103627 [Chitinophaga niastensis]
MNNLPELKAKLLEIHEKDKKQTITALIVAEVMTLLLLALVGSSIFSGNSSQVPAYVLWILACLPIGALVPYIIMLVQIKKRPARIEDFINRLQQGESVNNINTYTDYKLILPLRLIRVRLFPMEYAQVMVGQSRTAFKLPLSTENVQPFKALISRTDLNGNATAGSSTSANWSSN